MGEGELTDRVRHVIPLKPFALARSVELNIHRQKTSTVDQQELLTHDDQNQFLADASGWLVNKT